MASRVALWSSIVLPLLYTVSTRISSPIPQKPASDVFAQYDLAVSPPATYAPPRSDIVFERVHAPPVDGAVPDTTAVILNWKRLNNVVDIVAVLCDSSLRDVIAQVIVWNNNPTPIWHGDFLPSRCLKNRLRIINSKDNLKFQARFMACMRANTKYCYTQDDDYLVRPEIIRALQTRAHTLNTSHSLFLLPPHEHLSTSLRVTYSPAVHTSFVWLGHGAFLQRTQATEFLQLMHTVGAGSGELMMADNYFSVLANLIPEVWFDQGIGMGQEDAFTVGEEGRIRNERHIIKATEYLEGIVACDTFICGKLPYVNRQALPVSDLRLVRSAVRGSPHVLYTNIRLLPAHLVHLGQSAADMLRIESENLGSLDEDVVERYNAHPPSAAVDGNPNTAFKSFSNGHNGDYIALDLGTPTSLEVELAFLIAHDSLACLIASSYETSEDGAHWVRHHASWRCDEMHAPKGSGMEERYECSVVPANPGKGKARHVRVWLGDDVPPYWVVYEVWVRERKNKPMDEQKSSVEEE